MTKGVRKVYRVIRSLLLTIMLTAIGLVAMAYIVVSLPSVQRHLKTKAESELSALLGGKLKIGEVRFLPFNEVRLENVELFAPSGERVLSLAQAGGAVSLWTLFTQGIVKITYLEVIGLNASLSQQKPEAPWNIDFLVKALSRKDNSPPSDIEIAIKNAVVRKSRLNIDKEWIEKSEIKGFDSNHLCFSDINADFAFPLIHGNEITLNVKRLAFRESSGLHVKSLAFIAFLSVQRLSISDFNLKLANSEIEVPAVSVPNPLAVGFTERLDREFQRISIKAHPLALPDLQPFVKSIQMPDALLNVYIEAEGNPAHLRIGNFTVSEVQTGLSMKSTFEISDITDPAALIAEIDDLHIMADAAPLGRLLGSMGGPLAFMADYSLHGPLSSVGRINLGFAGKWDGKTGHAALLGSVHSDMGTQEVEVTADGVDLTSPENSNAIVNARLELNVNGLINAFPALKADNLSADVLARLHLNGGIPDGNAEVALHRIDYMGVPLENISLDISKNIREIHAILRSDNTSLDVDLDVKAIMDGAESSFKIAGAVPNVDGQFFGGANLTQLGCGAIDLSLSGNSPDNLYGELALQDFHCYARGKVLNIDALQISGMRDGHSRTYRLYSPIADIEISGDFLPSHLKEGFLQLASEYYPSLAASHPTIETNNKWDGNLNARIHIKNYRQFYDFMEFPLRPEADSNVSMSIDGACESMQLTLEAPRILWGRNKTLSALNFKVHGKNGMMFGNGGVELPVKNGIANLILDFSADKGDVDAGLGWKLTGDSIANNGRIGFVSAFGPSAWTGRNTLSVNFKPSSFTLDGIRWNIIPGDVCWSEDVLSVEGIAITNGLQSLRIAGKASRDPMDMLVADLKDIDLDYIFNILNINYVDFGGQATGRAVASSLFSEAPVARTDGLFVKGLAYNGAFLGDAEMESHWDNAMKMVAINADITEGEMASATVRGGVYVTRDSLSFNFNTHKIRIEMLQPFMSGFTSKVTGRASADLHLYGTFSEIDLRGWAYADTIALKVDQTGVVYSASDSIFFRKGSIDIPPLVIRDKYGHTGKFKGKVGHDFLRDAIFDFTLWDAQDLLCYDTDASSGSRWYGHILASGNATLKGVPGYLGVDIAMKSAPGSEFTFALEDTQTASDYEFLTFSDSSAMNLSVGDSIHDESASRKRPEAQDKPKDLFVFNMMLDVTPALKMNVIMDPEAGDILSGTGKGALRLQYSSATDALDMHGKYVIEKGSYNFSLQDLILKKFLIDPGSNITFNGDPLDGLLDITATYRVNTNLADLDPGFTTDPDLNRTSVPVEALLKVNGELQSPDIKFDFRMPTVTSEVDRKVRSIVSTEDMVNQQVVYLLALNRFYAPEYMGSSQGGEFASVASSTLSSQISNILGKLTDKFTLAPSLKSERDDFSDLAIDVALSSNLFNNRLLINGNLGYRDKSTSQTTFVGDFDIEYLLRHDGRLRLKAYNHFNDASYYLKSALTTQGLGIMYRKEFDDPLTFVKKWFKPKESRTKTMLIPQDKENDPEDAKNGRI